MSTVDPILNVQAERIDFPPRLFLYSLDQVAFCLDMKVETLRRSYIHFQGRTRGVAPKGLILARNIAGPQEQPTWRVAENELVRWMKHKGFVFVTSERMIR